MNIKQLRVAPSGNGMGQLLLAFQGKDRIVKVCLTIQPKFWANSQEQIIEIDLDLIAQFENVENIQIYEGSSIRVKSMDSRTLHEFVSALIQLDSPQDTVERIEALTKLFAEESVTANLGISYLDSDKHDSDCWELLSSLGSEIDLSELVKLPNFQDRHLDAISWANTFMAHDNLRNLITQLFVRNLEQALHAIRPAFVEKDISTKNFAGRADMRTLARFIHNVRNEFLATVSEMSSDNPTNQLLKSALSVVSSKGLMDESQTIRIQRLHRKFEGVTSINTQQVHNLVRKLNISHRNPRLANAIKFAKMIVLGSVPGIGQQTVRSNKAIATGIFFSSARLWELLLSQRELLNGLKIIADKEAIALRLKDASTGKYSKRPDLSIVQDQGAKLGFVDAKYKFLTGNKLLALMPNDDQYQQYAYSAATGLPSLFVYCTSGTEVSYEIDTLLVRGSTIDQIRIGAISIPFPKPENLDSWWNLNENAVNICVEELLNQIV